MTGMQGTPFSAGFGISGLIGPINHLNIVGYTSSNILMAALVFAVVPIVVGFICSYVYIAKLKLISEDDYYIGF